MLVLSNKTTGMWREEQNLFSYILNLYSNLYSNLQSILYFRLFYMKGLLEITLSGSKNIQNMYQYIQKIVSHLITYAMATYSHSQVVKYWCQTCWHLIDMRRYPLASLYWCTMFSNYSNVNLPAAVLDALSFDIPIGEPRHYTNKVFSGSTRHLELVFPHHTCSTLSLYDFPSIPHQ